MARGARDLGLERQWRGRVSRWAASGVSVRAFCRQHGLIETSFYYWKRELQARQAAAPTPSASVPKPPTFVPVAVMPAAALAVEVRCPSGHVVLLPACEITSLASVFAALDPRTRETPPC